MSKTIVDDTLYEKVLSYLTLVLSSNDLNFIIELDSQCHIFQHIKQACLEVENQDYRVTALSIRLLGQVIYHGKGVMFQQLVQQYPELLALLTKGIKSSEGALRCASIEVCRLFLQCSEAYQWLSKNKQLTSLITYSLLDQSSYVVSEACKLFSTLITMNAQDLLELMDPSTLVLSILDLDSDQSQILSLLDFCWAVVKTKEDNAMRYIRSKNLFSTIMSLLCSSDRMIRSKVLEILSVLFSWDDDPLKTLHLQDKEDDTSVDTAYLKLLSVSRAMIQKAVKVEDLMTGVSLLETLLVLMERSEKGLNSYNDICSMFLSLYSICMNEVGEASDHDEISKLLKTNRLKNNLIYIILRSMEKLSSICPQIVNESDQFITFFDVLDSETCYSGPKVLKAALVLLTITLQNMIKREDQQNLLTKATHSLVTIMDDDHTTSDYKSLTIVLKSFEDLLGHDQLGTLVTESHTSGTLVEALNYKFLDTEWDIRDSVVNFVGHLFDEPHNVTKIRFALTFNLPLEVFGRIHDSEPYVRASSLEVLAKMMQCKEGWDYIQQHTSSRELSSKLPNLLYDTEAFVRRAAIDAIICLVRNRSCQGMTMEIEDSKNKDSLNPQILQSLIDDQDFDVRIRACRLIQNLWVLYNHEKLQQKRKYQPEAIFFEHIHAGKLLVEAANDTNRVVRIEAYEVISSILSEYRPQEVINSNKRQLQNDDEFTTAFLDLISSVDLERLKYSLDPEHLYQEAFDINADMMTQSIVPTNPDDDINDLDCY